MNQQKRLWYGSFKWYSNILEAFHAHIFLTVLISFSGISDFSPFMDLQNRLHLPLRSHTSPQFWMCRMMNNNHWMHKKIDYYIFNKHVCKCLYTDAEISLKPVFHARASCAAACAVCTYCDRIRQQQSLSVYVARPASDKCLLSCWTY